MFRIRPENYCIYCKGTRKLCGLEYCPILKRIDAQHRKERELKEHVFGLSNEPFVGSSGWPDVSWGPVLSLGSHLGARVLYEKGYAAVVEYRAAMVRGKRFGGIRPEKRMVEETQEIALSARPVDVEMDFSRKPVYDMNFSSVASPVGASAPMKKVRVCENPKIPAIADKVIEEGMGAREAAIEMYSKGL
ncbi:MAG: hypothetical protein QXH30_01125, partial [Candidatus Bilamarchaeaceae archaeon]